ncbi:MAG: hypothetical protein DRJ65_00195 [Acidobacteria bacterium]|nr:MAG: hypothetical protein DRJ65_00195 [Acidobacteriota bacterium]
MKQIVILASVMLCFGCASEAIIPMTGVEYSPRKPYCKYETFGDEDDIERDFDVTCIIDAKTGTTAFHKHSIEAALEHIWNDICECGGDAIIVIGAEKDGAMSNFGAGWGKGKIKVKVIKYTDEEPK